MGISMPGATGFWTELALSVVFSAVYLSLLEHQLHRCLMHQRRLPETMYRLVPMLDRIFYNHAILHHKTYYRRFDFEADPRGKHLNLRLTRREVIPLYVIHLPIFLLVGSFSIVGAVTLAACGALQMFTWNLIHPEMHIPSGARFSRCRLFRYLSRHHYLHHQHPTKHFNIVLPLGDLLMGTRTTPNATETRELIRLGTYGDRRTSAGDGKLRGSCACGRVRYEIHGELLGPLTHCHCWRCRKHGGASFGTTAGVRADELIFVSGEQHLSNWESSPGVHRFFAACCGSPIYKRDEAAGEVLGFRLGTLDTDPERKAEMHFMVGSKAPWVEIQDSLPREAGGRPFGERD